MILQQRIELLSKLNAFIKENDTHWQETKQKAERENPWFIQPFIEKSVNNISDAFLSEAQLKQWASHYQVPHINPHPKTVGIVMAGNIPMVGFHDLLSVFVSGHKAIIKPSSKDRALIECLVQQLISYNAETASFISFADNLKGCDAYIATGSNNSGRYFEYYFGKYPHIIRKNKTSVAILDGTESEEALLQLATDMQLYFGLGCRNITKIYVPRQYDFIKLLDALKAFDYLMDLHKYKHNYDYQLALLLMNNKFYMSNGSVLLSENPSLFSAISHIHYEYYSDKKEVEEMLGTNEDVQCIVGKGFLPFGTAQNPSLTDYADGIDTMQFLMSI